MNLVMMTECMTRVCTRPLTFLTYQLAMVRYWLTVALTGNEGLGFDFGEGA